jgi:hypothetical protein
MAEQDYRNSQYQADPETVPEHRCGVSGMLSVLMHFMIGIRMPQVACSGTQGGCGNGFGHCLAVGMVISCHVILPAVSLMFHDDAPSVMRDLRP